MIDTTYILAYKYVKWPTKLGSPIVLNI